MVLIADAVEGKADSSQTLPPQGTQRSLCPGVEPGRKAVPGGGPGWWDHGPSWCQGGPPRVGGWLRTPGLAQQRGQLREGSGRAPGAGVTGLPATPSRCSPATDHMPLWVSRCIPGLSILFVGSVILLTVCLAWRLPGKARGCGPTWGLPSAPPLFPCPSSLHQRGDCAHSPTHPRPSAC